MIIPQKLKSGDEIRVIAPARSLALISEECRNIAVSRLEDLGLKVSFGKNVEEKDMFWSSSVESRVADLHAAFADGNVKGILTVIGGFNSNQILKYLDYDLIKNNPKVLCGYSDITALANAITAKTGLVTYSGLHFSTFGMKQHFDYNLDYFQKCLMSEGGFEVKASPDWSDDMWFLDQDKREIMPNEGIRILNSGQAEGRIVGGNLGTLSLLFGTEYMPDLSDSILFLEDCNSSSFDVEFDRNLQSLIQQPNFDSVRGVVFGRFQKESAMTYEKLKYIVETKAELKKIPIISGVDFGHSNPMITFPIGGQAKIDGERLEIISH